jgi:hypothetical protein
MAGGGLPTKLIVTAGGAVVGCGLTVLIFWWELRRFSPEGSARWRELRDYRAFLAGESSDVGTAEELAHLDIDGLRRHTSWALALGVVDQWHLVASAGLDRSGLTVTERTRMTGWKAGSAGLRSAVDLARIDPASS